MKNILLLNPPGTRFYLRDQYCSSQAKADYYWPAVDLLVLSGILKNHFNIFFIDSIVERKSSQDIINFVNKEKIEVVIALSSTASKQEDFELFRAIKKQTSSKLILNAGFLRELPQNHLKENSFIDAIVIDYIGKGIVCFIEGTAKEELEGLCYRKDDKIFLPSLDLKEEFFYSIPRHNLLKLNKYHIPQAKKHPFTSVIASYGCPFNCSFCSSSTIGFKLRHMDNLIDELKYLREIGVAEVHFPDFTFTADKPHVLNICKRMIKEKLVLSWDCLTRVDCFDEELASAMKEAGCHTIAFGVESKNEQVLNQLDKPISNETVKKAFTLSRKFGIETIGFFIIGLPGEDKTSLEQTIEFAQELDCDYAAYSIFVPDHGSKIRHILTEKSKDIPERFDRTEFPGFSAGGVSEQEIWDLRNKAIKKFYFRPKYIFKKLKGIRSFKEFKLVAKICASLLKR